MDRGQCTEYAIVLTRRCDRAYKKMKKKLDRRLYDQIGATLKSLKTDPLRGKKLIGNLVGWRSIRIDEFQYRIVYAIDNIKCQIIVHGVGHRSSVYDDLVSYLKRTA